MNDPTIADLQRAIERAVAACQTQLPDDDHVPLIVGLSNVSVDILPPCTVDRCANPQEDTPAGTWTITLRDTDCAIARGIGNGLPGAFDEMLDKINARYERTRAEMERVKP